MVFVNKVEIRAVNLGRSGSHAVINWIINLSSGKVCFLNSAEPSKNPFLLHAEKDLKGIGEKNFYRGKNGEITRKDLLIYSYEENELPEIFNAESAKNHDKFVGKSEKKYDILILRDPFNFFASRIK